MASAGTSSSISCRPSGYHILMDGMAGLIHSGDDFGMNSAGILITETTISRFSGFDPNGVPEFVRARKAMQYAASIDDFARIMKEGNNGGYANNWLVADRNTNEIADLELGLKNVHLERTRDGFFVGSNFPIDPQLIREETNFQADDAASGANARHARWLALMEENRGRIDVAAGQRFLADHYDTYLEEGRAERAHVMRPCRSFPARDSGLARAVRSRRRGAEQSHQRRAGREDVVHGRPRPRLRPRLPCRLAPGPISTIRMVPADPARHGWQAVDGVSGQVGGQPGIKRPFYFGERRLLCLLNHASRSFRAQTWRRVCVCGLMVSDSR